MHSPARVFTLTHYPINHCLVTMIYQGCQVASTLLFVRSAITQMLEEEARQRRAVLLNCQN